MRVRPAAWFAIAALIVAGLATGSLLRHRASASPGFATIALRDQDGTTRRLADWSGRVRVLDFVFTGCGDVCPLKTQQLAGVERDLPPALRDRVQFVSVSIDPEHDDPAALRRYAERNGVDPTHWSLLTGTLGDVARFAAAFELPAAPGSGGDPPSHVTTIQLIDASGRVAGVLPAEPLDGAALTARVTALAAREGTFTER